jgi:hypothetical protein
MIIYSLNINYINGPLAPLDSPLNYVCIYIYIYMYIHIYHLARRLYNTIQHMNLNVPGGNQHKVHAETS